MNINDLNAMLQQGLQFLNQGKFHAAATQAQQVLRIDPDSADAYFVLGLVRLRVEDAAAACDAFRKVVQLQPTHAHAWAHLAEAQVLSREYDDAGQSLEQACALGGNDPMLHQAIGLVLSRLDDHAAAVEWLRKSVAAQRDNIGFLLNLARCEMYLGHISEATAALHRIMALHAGIPEVHWLLATLEPASDRQHIRKMQALIDTGRYDKGSLAFLHYACGKEFEDMGAWPEAFDAFMAGAAAKRATIEYDEENEIALFESLGGLFSREWLDHGPHGCTDISPIFVIGQPRSGTTLVDRILSAHPAVRSAGELRQFGDVVNRLGGYDGPARFSLSAIRSAKDVDPGALGSAYQESSDRFANGSECFVDKMPPNYIYVPLILKALPRARIVHLRRGAMDTCFSVFKQLFTVAYPYSYCLDEIGRHYARYHELMGKWREGFGDRMHEVWYEDLVSDLEPRVRELLTAVDLPWDAACLSFHEQETAVATASTVQVRQKAHTRSIGRWRCYEDALTPVCEILEAKGVPLERSGGST